MEKEIFINFNRDIIKKRQLYFLEVILCDFEKQYIEKRIDFVDGEDLQKYSIKYRFEENSKYKLLFKLILHGKIIEIGQDIFNFNNVKNEVNSFTIEDIIKRENTNTNIMKIAINPKLSYRKENEKVSIYNNGNILFLKGNLKQIFTQVAETSSLTEIIKNNNINDKKYVEDAVNLLLKKGVLIEYAK